MSVVEYSVYLNVIEDIQGRTSGCQPVTFFYDPAAPIRVEMRYGDGVDNVWVFARSLLTDALGAPVGPGSAAGVGDLRVIPYPEKIRFVFRSPEGSGVFDAERWEIATFLDQTLSLVPEDREQVDVDAFLAGLMQGGETRG